jgi:hypothetical protein
MGRDQIEICSFCGKDVPYDYDEDVKFQETIKQIRTVAGKEPPTDRVPLMHHACMKLIVMLANRK